MPDSSTINASISRDSLAFRPSATDASRTASTWRTARRASAAPPGDLTAPLTAGRGHQAVAVHLGQGGQTEPEVVGAPPALRPAVGVLHLPTTGDSLGPQGVGLVGQCGQFGGMLLTQGRQRLLGCSQ